MSSIHLKNLSCVAGLSLVLLVLASSCAEKPAATASTPTKPGTATDTGTGDDDDSTSTKTGDDDDSVDTSKPFDLCTDGLVAKKATITGFDTYIEEL